MNVMNAPVAPAGRNADLRLDTNRIEIIGFDKAPCETTRWWTAFDQYLRCIDGMSDTDLYRKGLSLCGNFMMLKDNRYQLRTHTDGNVVPNWYANSKTVSCLRGDVDFGLYTFLHDSRVWQLKIIFPTTEQLVISATSPKRVDIVMAIVCPDN